jgi:hypothetical protein
MRELKKALSQCDDLDGQLDETVRDVARSIPDGDCSLWDDVLPVTVDWLRTIGAVDSATGDYIGFPNDEWQPVSFLLDDDAPGGWLCCSLYATDDGSHIKTRGDVRRLLAALDIKQQSRFVYLAEKLSLQIKQLVAQNPIAHHVYTVANAEKWAPDRFLEELALAFAKSSDELMAADLKRRQQLS